MSKNLLVLGGGLIGRRHVDVIAAHPGCRLVGLVDPNRDAAVPGVAHFGDMAEAADMAGAVDGVVIATPTHLHAENAQAAAARGWHVLIEKPVAESIAEATALTQALQNHGTRSLVGHHRRYHACVQQLRAMLRGGTIGEVVTVSAIWAMRKPDAYFEGNWRAAGGSPVMINLVHDIDLLRFCLGEITDVAALRGASLRGAARLESGAVALAFETGATGTISFADTAPSPWGFEAGTGENPNIGITGADMMWITGTKGAISFPSMSLWHGTQWGTPAQRVPLHKAENTQTPLEAQLDHFLAVMDGAPPLIDVEDAGRTLAVAIDIETQLARQTARAHQPEPA